MSETFDAIVIGGGIVGVATARALTLRGAKTLLLEKGAFNGAVTGASLACLGTHMHGLAELPLLMEATRLWDELAVQFGPDMEFHRSGQLRFVLDEADIPVARGWVDGERAAGLKPELLDPAGVRAVEPLLTGPIVAATWSPDSATVNPFLATRTLLADAVRNGLEARPHTAVRGLAIENGRVTGVATAHGRTAAGAVVAAAGPWTSRILGEVGIRIPIVPRQAQCLASTRQPPRLNTVIGACESAGGVDVGYTQIQQARSGQILFNTVTAGGVTEPGAEDEAREAPANFVVDSIRMLVRLFPSLAGLDLLRSWARFEAVTPDARFLCGPTPIAGLSVVAGCNGSGFCRAPMLAARIADLVTDGQKTPDVYDPARFGDLAA